MVLFFAKTGSRFNATTTTNSSSTLKSRSNASATLKRHFSYREVPFVGKKASFPGGVKSRTDEASRLPIDSSIINYEEQKIVANSTNPSTPPAGAKEVTDAMGTVADHSSALHRRASSNFIRTNKDSSAQLSVNVPIPSSVNGGGGVRLQQRQQQYSSSKVCRDDSAVALLSRDHHHQFQHQLGDGGGLSSCQQYELSSDFQQKQTEILERKYGGRVRARRAAVIVQRAYRKYAMTKKFEHLRNKRRTLPCGGSTVSNTDIVRGNNNSHHNAVRYMQQNYPTCSWLLSPDRQQRFLIHHNNNYGNRNVSTTPVDCPEECFYDNVDHMFRPTLIGQKSDSAILLNNSNHYDDFATSSYNNCNGPRLKLHRYNVGGRTHLSAPLTAQLKAEQQQQQQQQQQQRFAKSTFGNLHQEGHLHNGCTTTMKAGVVSSVIHVQLNESGSPIVKQQQQQQQSSNRMRSISMERAAVVAANQYGATTALNLLSASSSSSQPPAVLKILSNENEILNAPSSVASSPTLSPCRVVADEHAPPPRVDVGKLRQTQPSHVSTAASVATASTVCSAQPQFHPTVKLQKIVHHTNSADSVQDLYSSVGGNNSDASGCHKPYASGNVGSADSSPRRSVTVPNNNSSCVYKVSGGQRQQQASPIWLPRRDKKSSLQIVDLHSINMAGVSVNTSIVGNTVIVAAADGQEPSTSCDPQQSHNQNNPVLCSSGIPATAVGATAVVESPSHHASNSSHFVNHWGRRSIINASLRRTDLERKRQYRIALNFFNKKPERGVSFLIKWNFVEATPSAVAKFLISRKGISKQMIGEYLGNLQNPFNTAVLNAFVNEVNLHNMEIDSALRQFQTLFRLPGEAQKIERIVEVFARRYCDCNHEQSKQFKQPDTIFILAFAIIMLNTDLHSPNIKPERRMKMEDFIKNLRGIDGGLDVNPKFLTDIYGRVKEQEFKHGSDHVTQVLKVERSIDGKKPTLALPHRRLVCYCRLYEVLDPAKKQSVSVHQREVFLFNDMLMITKISSKKKNVVTYNYRQSHCLVGMQVQMFRNQLYPNGLRIVHTLENKILHFNARNEEDRTKFVEDLHEAILESDEMEALRINLELEKQSSYVSTGACRSHSLGRNEQQRDSGLGDLDNHDTAAATASVGLRKKAVSNSLLDVSIETPPGDQVAVVAAVADVVVAGDKRRRRASGTSLDSGMSSNASIASRDSSSPLNSMPVVGAAVGAASTSSSVATDEINAAVVVDSPKVAGSKPGGFSFSEFFGGTKKQQKNQHQSDANSNSSTSVTSKSTSSDA